VILAVHVTSAIAGIVGAYLWSGAYFYLTSRRGTQRASMALRVGQWLTAIGIAGVVVSGAALFMDKPDAYMQSAKFLLFISLAMVLLVVEAASYIKNDAFSLKRLRLLSATLWTLMFTVALLYL
jgi:uncharacterized membrane protein